MSMQSFNKFLFDFNLIKKRIVFYDFPSVFCVYETYSLIRSVRRVGSPLESLRLHRRLAENQID